MRFNPAVPFTVGSSVQRIQANPIRQAKLLLLMPRMAVWGSYRAAPAISEDLA